MKKTKITDIISKVRKSPTYTTHYMNTKNHLHHYLVEMNRFTSLKVITNKNKAIYFHYMDSEKHLIYFLVQTNRSSVQDIKQYTPTKHLIILIQWIQKSS